MTAEPFVSYAQNGEDVVLARALQPDTRTGFWIDVGAGDPQYLSVTAAFAERGWHGVNIEPLPSEHERLCAARPGDVNLRVALGSEPGRGKLFTGPPENLGSSTLVREIAESYQEEGEDFTPIEVVITTLAEVVSEHAPACVDFLKIDVEGFERQVLEGADWSVFRPRIIVIEATRPNSRESSHADWEPILLEHGYRCALFDGLNRFYARDDEPELYASLTVPANVYDNFVPQVWADQLRAATNAMHIAEANARQYQDRLAIARDDEGALREDLDAAQRMTVHVLDGLELAQKDAAEVREAYDNLQAERAALLNTRLYRYTASMRRVYGALRRRLKRLPAEQ